MKKPSQTELHQQAILHSLRFLATQWSKQFEDPPNLPITFGLSGDWICFGSKELCKAEEVDLSTLEIEVVYFAFETYSGERYCFLVDWPFNSPIQSFLVIKNGKEQFLCEPPEDTQSN